MLDYLDRQELRIPEPVTMIINDRLSLGITLASVIVAASVVYQTKQGVWVIMLYWDFEAVARPKGWTMSSSWIQPNWVVAWEGKGDGVEHKEEARR